MRVCICLNMSASKSELASNARGFQYQFDLEILNIKLMKAIEIPQPAFMEVVWRRGQNNITTKVKPEVKGCEEQILFNEKLSMISTCILNGDTKQFNVKESIVTVVINLAGSPKTFGSISLNLSMALNPHNQREPLVRFLEEELAGRTKSKIFFKLSSSYLKEMVKGDQQSRGSGVVSTSTKFNTSAYSINYDPKKCQIPSKDTYSVASYSNSIRFSTRKDEASSLRREDSAKDDQKPLNDYNYGYYNTTSGTNFFNNASKEYNLNRGSGSNMPPSSMRGGRNSDSEANKSSAGEQNSRMLAEEQNKRSRLEAENTKSKVENAELKKKLSEYVRENMKLKDEVKKFGENNDSRHAELKKENEELFHRNYVLSQEVRELKTRFDKYHCLEKEAGTLREDHTRLLRDLASAEDSLRQTRGDCEVLKNQALQLRESETSARKQLREVQEGRREREEAQKREYQGRVEEMQKEIEYAHSNLKALNFNMREKEAKQCGAARELGEKEKMMQGLKDEHNAHIQSITYQKEKELREVTEKLDSKTHESQEHYLQLYQLRNEAQRTHADWELRHKNLTADIDTLNLALSDSASNAQTLLREKTALELHHRNLQTTLAKECDKTRALSEEVRGLQACGERETGHLRRAMEGLEQRNRELEQRSRELEQRNRELEQRNKELEQRNKELEEKVEERVEEERRGKVEEERRGKVEEEEKRRKVEEVGRERLQMESLMKQNLQYELEVKYKSEQLCRLKGLEEEYENLLCRAGIQDRNYKEIQEALEHSQKDLKEKARALILESERVRMLTEERASSAKTFAELKQEFETARNIIFNGERQVKDMDQHIFECERKNHELERQIQVLSSKLDEAEVEKLRSENRKLEARAKELDKRNSEKLLTLENLNKNLSGANQEIKNLQGLSEERLREVQQRDLAIEEINQKLALLQGERERVEKELEEAQQERRNAGKKNEMLMEELYIYKKKLEEEKGRSVSSVHIRNSEDYIKIRSLENEVQKKQEKVGKLEKELINLENENVKLNIEIMKKLDDFTPQ